jgi:hypothetical protein
VILLARFRRFASSHDLLEFGLRRPNSGKPQGGWSIRLLPLLDFENLSAQWSLPTTCPTKGALISGALRWARAAFGATRNFLGDCPNDWIVPIRQTTPSGLSNEQQIF